MKGGHIQSNRFSRLNVRARVQSPLFSRLNRNKGRKVSIMASISIINNNALNTGLTTAGIKSKELLASTRDIIALEERILGTAKSASEEVSLIRAKQAGIFAIIKDGKLYEKDGFKSFSEYAEHIGFKKALASQMTTSGKVYNDATAPKALKDKSVSVLGALGSLINNDKTREALYKDAESTPDFFEKMTLDSAKEYARAHTTPSKGKVVPTYKPIDAETGKEIISEYRTLEELEKLFKEAGEEIELFKLPKSEKGLRWVIIHKNGVASLVLLHHYEDAKKNGEVKTAEDRKAKREMLARSLAMGNVALNVANDILKGQGFATMTEKAYNALKG